MKKIILAFAITIAATNAFADDSYLEAYHLQEQLDRQHAIYLQEQQLEEQRWMQMQQQRRHREMKELQELQLLQQMYR